MDNEPYRVLTHSQAVAEIKRLTEPHARAVYTECRLPHGKVADVLVIAQDLDVCIFEVKTDYRPSHELSAIRKYSPYADWLTLVVPGLRRSEVMLAPQDVQGFLQTLCVGLYSVEWSRMLCIREPKHSRMLAENRTRLFNLLGFTYGDVP
jgi:hypothetical protein